MKDMLRRKLIDINELKRRWPCLRLSPTGLFYLRNRTVDPLPHLKIGKILYNPKEIRDWLKRRRVPPQPKRKGRKKGHIPGEGLDS